MRLGLCIIAIFGLFCISQEVHGQIYGSNLLEMQYGNIPFEENRELTTTYDQLNLYIDYGNFMAYGRLEQFLSQPHTRSYFSLSQKRLQYEDDNFKIRIGNFYETLGRGVLLRSYEIPGSVYEDRFYRTRYSFHRDLEGVAIDYTGDRLEAKILHGRPLHNVYPPNVKPDSLLRPDLVQAVYLNAYATASKDMNVGATLFRNSIDDKEGYEDYIAVHFNVNLPFDLQVYSEFATDFKGDFISFNNEDVYALYSGMNYFFNEFGFSLEYKNYSNFQLGSGFNNPPSLIKEHPYPVLNRSTHVLQATNEKGLQAEIFFNAESGHSVIANYTMAVNELNRNYQFREYFVEGTYQLNDLFSLKSFLDYARDELFGEEDRVSAGLIAEKSFNYIWSLTLDLQYQTFRKSFNSERNNRNYYGALSVSYLPDLILSLVAEASTDLSLTDDPRTFEVEKDTRTWLGGNIRYKINRTHTLDLFAGKRRGGPVCTSGICYEVLDFEGVEVRFTTRF